MKAGSLVQKKTRSGRKCCDRRISVSLLTLAVTGNLLMSPLPVQAQSTSPATADQNTQELLRQQERERQLRGQQERTADARLEAPAADAVPRLPVASFGFKDERQSAVKAAWKQRMDVCGLLIGNDPLPDDPSLTRLLAVSAIGMNIATAEELLATHGKALAERARSQTGDLRSLRVLAALQVLAKDPQLVESDDLGWSRYGDPEFAHSRVLGQLKDGMFNAEGLALLEQAHKTVSP